MLQKNCYGYAVAQMFENISKTDWFDRNDAESQNILSSTVFPSHVTCVLGAALAMLANCCAWPTAPDLCSPTAVFGLLVRIARYVW